MSNVNLARVCEAKGIFQYINLGESTRGMTSVKMRMGAIKAILAAVGEGGGEDALRKAILTLS